MVATADVLVVGNGVLGKVVRTVGEMDPDLSTAEVAFVEVFQNGTGCGVV